jgi:hypothetical protein
VDVWKVGQRYYGQIVLNGERRWVRDSLAVCALAKSLSILVPGLDFVLKRDEDIVIDCGACYLSEVIEMLGDSNLR